MGSLEKRLYLSEKDKCLAGVCGGVAEYLNLDSTVVRVVYIVSAVLTAFIPLTIIYLACMLVIPKKPH